MVLQTTQRIVEALRPLSREAVADPSLTHQQGLFQQGFDLGGPWCSHSAKDAFTPQPLPSCAIHLHFDAVPTEDAEGDIL